MANYRGITLLDTVSKLFNRVVADRLLEHAEEACLLHEAQNAFRPGRSTDQHIYTLSQVVRGRLRQGKATYAFFLDLKKAYDTVWRDGLLYKLWNKGIKGRMWQYISSMYAATTRAVRCGQHTSQWFDIDLGTAQGDTLSCILFDLFVDDMLREVDATCPGVPLPVPPQPPGPESPQPAAQATAPSANEAAATLDPVAVKALMFADDFTGVAETAETLQPTVDVCHAWCSKWRMAANIGPAKTAVVVFAPQFAPATDPQVTWGGTPLPVADAYKYLGAQLHQDCTWHAHHQHAAAKGRAASYKAAPVLHNRKINLEVRRMVLLSVVRPAMDYASTVWHGTDQELTQLEQVQTRALRRLVATQANVADDFLRCELACRHTAQIGQQRKLEFAFELGRMSADRLPALIAQCDWGKHPVVNGRARPKLHADVTKRIAAEVGLCPQKAADDPNMTAGAFKTAARTAVLTTAMRNLRQKHAGTRGKSTMANYLQIIGPKVTEFPNALPKYLHTPLHRGTQLKLLYRAGFAPVAHTQSKKGHSSPECIFCEGCDDETAEHHAIECPAFSDLRQQLLDGVHTLLGPARLSEWSRLSPKDQLNALLGDQWWGAHAQTGDEWMKVYLEELEKTRRALSPNTRTCTLPAGDGARAHGSGYG
jgi:hypothetical protein